MNTSLNTPVAVEVAKTELLVKTDQQSVCVHNTAAGLRRLCVWLKTIANPWVVCEASGGYEKALVRALHRNAVVVSVLSPSRVRAFARSEGIKAKTDPIDVSVLLRFAQQKQLRPTPYREPDHDKLVCLMDRRCQIVRHISQEKNRQDKDCRYSAASIRRVVAALNRELARIEKQIESTIEGCAPLKAKAQIISSVAGVGAVTTWSILAYMNEITQLSRPQLASLAGVAPFNRDSGQSQGKRSIYGGRAKLRRSLYMAARSAASHNEVITAYVARLTDRGKPYKCALVAAMRKMLIHIQSLLKQHELSLAQ